MPCRLKGSQVSAYSLHPGVVATNLARHLFSAKAPDWLIPFLPFIKSVQQVRFPSWRLSYAWAFEKLPEEKLLTSQDPASFDKV